MWRKIYNAIWADKARRAAVLTIIIALIVSGTALAILNTIGKSKPAQGIPDEQPLIGTEVADKVSATRYIIKEKALIPLCKAMG